MVELEYLIFWLCVSNFNLVWIFQNKNRLLRKGGKHTIFLFRLLFSLSCLINRDISVFLPSHSKGYTTRWEFLLNSHNCSGLYFHACMCSYQVLSHIYLLAEKGGTILNFCAVFFFETTISNQTFCKSIFRDLRIRNKMKPCN